MNSTRNLIKVCINCKEIIEKPRLDKKESEICRRCKKLVVQYYKEHRKAVVNNE